MEMALARSASTAAQVSRESAFLEGDSDTMLRCVKLLRMFTPHVSPFRQFKIQLQIVTDRAVSAEFFRHKYVEGENNDFEAVERSTRYVDFGDTVPVLRETADTFAVVMATSSSDPEYVPDIGLERVLREPIAAYRSCRGYGGKEGNDLARRMLPFGIVTRLVVANSLEGWARLYLRRHDRRVVDPMMVVLAKRLFEAMEKAFPTLWLEMLGAVARPDSACELRGVVSELRRTLGSWKELSREEPDEPTQYVAELMAPVFAAIGLALVDGKLVGRPWYYDSEGNQRPENYASCK